jgi:DNA-binding transcriptional LysR family regulator
VEVEVVVDATDCLLELLDRGELDLAVVVVPNRRLVGEPAAYRTRPVLREPFAAYAPAPGASVAAGADARWVSYPRHSNTRALIDAALTAAGITPRVVTESANPEVLVQLVRLGVGWAVLPVDVAERGPEPLARVGDVLLERALACVERADRPGDAVRDALVEELLAGGRSAPGP